MTKTSDYKEELLDLAAEAFEAADRERVAALEAESRRRRLEKKGHSLRAKAGQLAAAAPQKERGAIGYQKTTGLIDLRWPLRQALVKRKWSIPDMLTELGIPRADLSAATVRSWLKPSQPRAVPEVWALYFESAFTPRDKSGKITGRSEVPAVDASWPGGIRWEEPRN